MSHNRVRIWVLLVAGLVAGASAESRRVLTASQADAGKASIQERLNRVRADLFSRAERVNDDIRELKEILALDPRSAEGHMLLGIAYRSLGSADLMGEAKAEFQQALELNPGYVPARLYLAKIYLDLNRAEKAREELDTALRQLPGDPQLLAMLGEAERQLGNPQRSVEVNRQALQADASFAQAHYYLGLALFDLGQRAEGIRELEQVIQSGEKRADVYLSLGSAYLESGRVENALAALREGTAIEPSRADLRIQMARAYRAQGLLVKADEQLKLAMSRGAPTLTSSLAPQVESDLYLEQGFVRLQQGRLTAAADAFKKVLEMDPNHGPANRSLADVYLRQGLYALSFEHAAKAEKLGFPLPEDKRKLLQEKLHKKDPGARE